jgi:hypothetical protein
MYKTKNEAHGRPLRRFRSVIDERVARRLCLGKLGCVGYQAFPPETGRSTRTRRINATYIELSKVLTISPGGVVGTFRWHDPLLAFSGQAVQYCLPERPIWDIKLEQQALLLGLFAFDLAKSSHEVTFWITRSYIPLVNSHKDLLTNQRWCLAGAHPNAWEEPRYWGCEYSLLRKRCRCG